MADTPDDYIDIACALAKDRVALAEIRAGLRAQMRQSPLLDAPGLTRDFEAALRQIWHDYCSEVNG